MLVILVLVNFNVFFLSLMVGVFYLYYFLLSFYEQDYFEVTEN